MRWLRLDCSWSKNDWVGDLEPESRLAWIELLCYVKAYGSYGAVKRTPPHRFAAANGLSEESVKQMEDAAIESGALVSSDGTWQVAKWNQYQEDATAAQRKARQRAKTGHDCHGSHGDARDVTDVTTTKTITKTDIKSSYATLDNKLSTKCAPAREGGTFAGKDTQDGFATQGKGRGGGLHHFRDFLDADPIDPLDPEVLENDRIRQKQIRKLKEAG